VNPTEAPSVEYSYPVISRANPKLTPYRSPLGSDDPSVWASAHSDLDLARMTKANLLIVGTKRVANLLSFLLPELNPVVMIQPEDGSLLLPPVSAQVRTAVVRDVDALTCQEQRRLLKWLLDSAGHRMQVVSTASAPLLPLVETGTFHDALYYRLNTVYIDLSE
jgi:hypothetical protein